MKLKNMYTLSVMAALLSSAGIFASESIVRVVGGETLVEFPNANEGYSVIETHEEHGDKLFTVFYTSRSRNQIAFTYKMVISGDKAYFYWINDTRAPSDMNLKMVYIENVLLMAVGHKYKNIKESNFIYVASKL